MRKVGKFEIVSELGQGAMGMVYRGRDPVLERDVALKTISAIALANPDALGRFRREAQAAARLQHPNIVTIYELGEDQGTVYIAMELLEGMDLAQAMTPPVQIPPDKRLKIVLDLCRGLDFAHKRGVVHRDVKPANVRLLPDGGVKVLDFGIARLGASPSMTASGLILGTPSYMAPEILLDAGVDHRADIWAVGVILYELLAGKRPYEAPTIASLIYRIVNTPHPPIESSLITEPLRGVIDRALQKDPAQRYQDLGEMAQAIEHTMGLATSNSPLPPEARRKAARGIWVAARQLMGMNDLNGAFEAALRARSLDPSNADVLTLLAELEKTLGASVKAPAAAKGAASAQAPPPAPAGAAKPETKSTNVEPTGALDMTPEKKLPTAVLTELRARGASAFRELATFGEPPGTQAAALAPSGTLLATAGADGALRVWDLYARTRVAVLRTDMHKRSGHDARAVTLAFSPDASVLASGHVDGSVHLWDMQRNEEIAAKLRHDGSVGAVAFAPDRQVLATGGMDATVRVWDVPAAREGEVKSTSWKQPAPVTALAFAAGGQVLVSGHSNRIVRLLHSGTGRITATLRGPEGPVSLICALPDGRRVAVASQDRSIRFFDLETQKELFAVAGQRKPTSALSFFADGSHMATVSQDNAVHLWDLDARAPVAALWGDSDESFAGLGLFGSGDHIAVALADGRIRLWGPSNEPR